MLLGLKRPGVTTQSDKPFQRKNVLWLMAGKVRDLKHEKDWLCQRRLAGRGPWPLEGESSLWPMVKMRQGSHSSTRRDVNLFTTSTSLETDSFLVSR